MPLLLLLETATDICSIGLCRDGELLSLVEIDERADHAARINELILEACRQANVALEIIDAVAVSKGPGSYTSLRVGAATAKGICYALDKPLVAADTLEAIARASQTAEAGTWRYAPMIDARRMEVYTAIYDQHFQLLQPAHPLIIEPDVLAPFLDDGAGIVIAGNGAAKSLPILSGNIQLQEVRCSAAHLVDLAQESFRQNRFEDIAYFEPLYLKPPNITKSKKRL